MAVHNERYSMNRNQSKNLSLDLTHAPAVLYFYGLAGVGKSFVGDLVGKHTGWPVYHADSDLTDEMKQAIAEKKSFTPAMRDRYFAIVAERILELRRMHLHLIVTQATYKAEHRNFLMTKIPDMALILVTAAPDIIVDRLRARGDAVTPEYAATMAKNFESPPSSAKCIKNEGGEVEILSQLAQMYGK